MKIGSLFSGAGMLDYAVCAAFGGETVWHSELNPAACKVLAARFPGVPNLGDITAVDWSAVEPVDVLCGGFPCQDVSSAGRRAGLAAGTRSGLWSIFALAIAELRPRYVVVENVRGLLSAKAHRPMECEPDGMGDGHIEPVLRAIGAVLGDLSDLGYDACWQTFAAASVGAPHRRERVFVVAYPDGGRRQDGAKLDGDATPNTADWYPRGRDADRRIGATSVELLPTPTTQDGANCAGPSQFDRNSQPLNVVATLLPTPGAADTRGQDYARADREGSGGDDLVMVTVKGHNANQWGKYAAAIARWEAVTRPAPPPTEPNRNGNPRLNPAFSEWMMGWPDGWVTDLVPSPWLRVDPDIAITRNEALRIIGNGVAPHQAFAALQYLLAVIEVAV